MRCDAMQEGIKEKSVRIKVHKHRLVFLKVKIIKLKYDFIEESGTLENIRDSI